MRVSIKRRYRLLNSALVLLAFNMILGFFIYMEYKSIAKPQDWRPWIYAKDFFTLEIALSALLFPILRRSDIHVDLDEDGAIDTELPEVYYRLNISSQSDIPPMLCIDQYELKLIDVVDLETKTSLPVATVRARVEPENITLKPGKLPMEVKLILFTHDESDNPHARRCKGKAFFVCRVHFLDKPEKIKFQIPINCLIG